MKMTIHNNRDKTRGTSRKSGGDGAVEGGGGGGCTKKSRLITSKGIISGNYTHLGRPLTRVALVQVFSEGDVLVVYLPQQTGQLLFVPPVPATTPGESGVVTAIQSVQPQYHCRELLQV